MEVANILSKLNNSIEMEVYLTQIAEETGISKESIFEEIKKARERNKRINRHNKFSSLPNESKEEQKSSISNRIDEKDGLYKAQLNILRVISKNESIFQIIKEHLSFSEFIDPTFSKAAMLIYQAYDKDNSIEAAKIINHFESVEEQNQVSFIFNEEKMMIRNTMLKKQ